MRLSWGRSQISRNKFPALGVLLGEGGTEVHAPKGRHLGIERNGPGWSEEVGTRGSLTDARQDLD